MENTTDTSDLMDSKRESYNGVNYKSAKIRTTFMTILSSAKTKFENKSYDHSKFERMDVVAGISTSN